MAVMKLMMVAVLCAVWCAARMDVQPLTPGSYPVITDNGVVRREYCLWGSQRMLLGSRWTSLDCYKCQCTTWKKTCEREDGPLNNAACMRIFDEDCDELIVRRDNLYAACDGDLITGK